jgi:hypothetical protein
MLLGIFRDSALGGVFREKIFRRFYTPLANTTTQYQITFNTAIVINAKLTKRSSIPLTLSGAGQSALAPSNLLAPSNSLAPSDGIPVGMVITPALNRRSGKAIVSAMTVAPSETLLRAYLRVLASGLSLAVTEAPRRIYARSVISVLSLGGTIGKKVGKLITVPVAFFVNSSRGGQALVNLPAVVTVALTQSTKRGFVRSVATSVNLVNNITRFIITTINAPVSVLASVVKLPKLKLAMQPFIDSRMVFAPARTRQLATSISLLSDLQRYHYATRVMNTTLAMLIIESHNNTQSQIGLNVNASISVSTSIERRISKQLHTAITISALLANIPAEQLHSTLTLSANLARTGNLGKQLAVFIVLNQAMGVSPTVTTKDFGYMKLVSAVLVSK